MGKVLVASVLCLPHHFSSQREDLGKVKHFSIFTSICITLENSAKYQRLQSQQKMSSFFLDTVHHSHFWQEQERWWCVNDTIHLYYLIYGFECHWAMGIQQKNGAPKRNDHSKWPFLFCLCSTKRQDKGNTLIKWDRNRSKES